MRSKAPLMMMEQMVMLLVFALAAALCLQAFVKSDGISRRSEARDRAVIAAQNAAEAIRYCGGDGAHALTGAAELLGADYRQGLFWLDYDENWTPIPSGDCGMEKPKDKYRLSAQGIPSETPGLWTVQVVVECTEDPSEPEILFELNVSWQEDSAHE